MRHHTKVRLRLRSVIQAQYRLHVRDQCLRQADVTLAKPQGLPIRRVLVQHHAKRPLQFRHGTADEYGAAGWIGSRRKAELLCKRSHCLDRRRVRAV